MPGVLVPWAQSTALAITVAAGPGCSMAGQAVHFSPCVGELSISWKELLGVPGSTPFMPEKE